MRKIMLFISLFMLVYISGCAEKENDKEAFPTRELEIVIPGASTGGWGQTAKGMQSILTNESITDQSVVLTSLLGGNGEKGWKYLQSQDGHSVAMNSSLLLTNNLIGQSALTYRDFTPIAMLSTEWEVIVVSKNSDIKEVKDIIKKLQEDPASLKLGISPGIGNDDHLSFIQGINQYGINGAKLDFSVYEDRSSLLSALLKRKLDVTIMPLSEAKPYYREGKIKMLAISSEKRIENFKEVPTWKEQGLNVVFSHWRGVMGPKGMTDEQIKYWDEKIKEMVETEQWQQILKENEWESFYKNHEETKVFLQEEALFYKKLVNGF